LSVTEFPTLRHVIPHPWGVSGRGSGAAQVRSVQVPRQGVLEGALSGEEIVERD